MADPSNYRNNEEVQENRARDPIDKFRDDCIEAGKIDDDDISLVAEQIDLLVQEAREFAEQSPEPTAEDLYTHIYAEPEGN
jgi:pyruvate dehydrogenase E1 component alpha subunit